MGMFTHFSDLFPLSAMTGEDPASAFPSYSLWYKTLVGDLHIMTAVQTKYYGVWALAEVGMVLAGASKRVDEGGQAHWDLYNNFDGIRLNTASSPRLMPTYWNIGTGNWLR